jgi:hypothetical protein
MSEFYTAQLRRRIYAAMREKDIMRKKGEEKRTSSGGGIELDTQISLKKQIYYLPPF